MGKEGPSLLIPTPSKVFELTPLFMSLDRISLPMINRKRDRGSHCLKFLVGLNRSFGDPLIRIE